MMDTFDKLKIIEGLCELPTFNKDDIKYELISPQSIKVLHPCGCYFVQHGYSGNSNHNNPEIRKRNTIDRQFFVELCKEHTP